MTQPEVAAPHWLPAVSLADLLPAAARALGSPLAGRGGSGGTADHGGTADALTLPEARIVVVLLVDGLGDLLLGTYAGHAPFLRSLRDGANGGVPRNLGAGFPSSTATSLGMFGTGLLPGAHGLVGIDVLDPDRDVIFNELAWDPAVDPHRWQPSPTVFEQLAAAGKDVIRIGPGFFDGSGLTEAVQRGGRFVAAKDLTARVSAAHAAARSARSGLIYVYWGDIDKIGHEQGVGSWPWLEELEQVDSFTRRLAEGLPSDALLVVTADHGMIDCPFERRIDIAHEPELAAGVRLVGGEARALQLYCQPGAVADVADAWRERLQDSMLVLTRAEAVAAGWFGPVSPHVLPRIGDIVTSAVDDLAVVDSRTARPQILALRAYHGARTEVETMAPLLVTPGLAKR